HDLVAPSSWCLLCCRRLTMREHHLDLAAERLLIELERGLALAVERQIRVYVHRPSSPLPPPAATYFCFANCCSRARSCSTAALRSKSSSSKSWRISISPSLPSPCGPGARFAQPIASSFDFTWINQ